MKTLQLASAVLALSISSAYANQNNTAEQFAAIHGSSGTTAFCGCSYSDWKLDESKSCRYYLPKNLDRTIEWYAPVKPKDLAKSRECWGKGGIKNCLTNDEAVKYMQADPLIYLPSEPNSLELSGDLDIADGNVGIPAYGNFCKSTISPADKSIRLRKESKGDAARTIQYAVKRYNVETTYLSSTLEKWSTDDPVDALECEKHARAVKVLGYGNPFVLKQCKSYTQQ